MNVGGRRIRDSNSAWQAPTDTYLGTQVGFPEFLRNTHDVHVWLGHTEDIFGLDMLGMLLSTVIIPNNHETRTTLRRFQGPIYPAI